MWRMHRLQQEQQPTEGGECSKGVLSGRKCVDLSTTNAEVSEMHEGQPRALKRARGRGSLGPRSDLEDGQHSYYDAIRYTEPDDTMKFESRDTRIDKDTKSRSSHRHKKRRRDKTGEGEKKQRSSKKTSRKKTDSFD
jgi:hypothetical protein